MPPDEGLALYDAALAAAGAVDGPFLEVGSYCGKSAVYLGAAAQARRAGAVRGRPPPGLGGEPAGLGVARARPRRPRRRADGHAAVLPAHGARRRRSRTSVVAVVGHVARGRGRLGDAAGVPVHRRRPRRRAGPGRLRRAGPRTSPPAALLAIHDVFPDPADGGRPPYEEIYLPGARRRLRRRVEPPAPSASSTAQLAARRVYWQRRVPVRRAAAAS